MDDEPELLTGTCRTLSRDVSIHWWPAGAAPGDPCLCGRTIRLEGGDVDLDGDLFELDTDPGDDEFQCGWCGCWVNHSYDACPGCGEEL